MGSPSQQPCGYIESRLLIRIRLHPTSCCSDENLVLYSLAATKPLLRNTRTRKDIRKSTSTARRSKPTTTTKKLQATYANYSQVNQLMCLTLYREPGNQQLSSDASANEPTSYDAIHASTSEHVNTFALASTTSQTTFFQWFHLPRCFQEHNPLQFAIHLKTQNHRRHSPRRTLLLNHQQHLHPLSQPHKQTLINPSELALVEL